MGCFGMVAMKYSDDMATYLLKHPVGLIRSVTLDALAKLGRGVSSVVRDAVGNSLSDPEQVVRQSAVRAVGEIGATEHAQAVRSALDDDRPGVRAAAIETLGNIV